MLLLVREGKCQSCLKLCDKAAITLVQYAIKEDFRAVLLEECPDVILIILT